MNRVMTGRRNRAAPGTGLVLLLRWDGARVLMPFLLSMGPYRDIFNLSSIKYAEESEILLPE